MPTSELPLDDAFDYATPDVTGYQDRLAALRESKGVARLRLGSRTAHALLRFADVREAFVDNERFSKSLVLRPATFPIIGPNIQGYDGDEHRVKRGLVASAFRPRTVRDKVRPLIEAIAEELADEIAPLGEAELMATFAKRLPLRVITRLLGIPDDDEDRMAAWAMAMIQMSIDPERARRATGEFTQYVAPLVARRRADPADDLLSTIVTEEVEGQRLSDEEVYGFLRLLFPAGADTTWLTLGTLMIAVLGNPEVHDRLRASEEERGWAVEETLRWETTTGTEGRETTQDVVLSGVHIPAGELVWLILPVANRDPREFVDPDRWDLDRRPQHLGFGLGSHFCLGAYLARVELNVALEVLLRRLPGLRLTNASPIYGATLRGPRHVHMAWDAGRA